MKTMNDNRTQALILDELLRISKEHKIERWTQCIKNIKNKNNLSFSDIDNILSRIKKTSEQDLNRLGLNRLGLLLSIFTNKVEHLSFKIDDTDELINELLTRKELSRMMVRINNRKW